MPINKTKLKQKIITILLGVLFSIIILEAGIRMVGFVFWRVQEYRNRISIKQRGTYRILCLGESTTALWGGYAYPSQLEKILNQRDIGIKFSVINKGIPGTNTGVIMSVIEDNLDKYSPDMVITMMGINDGEGTIAYEGGPVSKTIPFFKAFRTYKLATLLRLHIKNKAQEVGIYKEKEGLNVRTDDLTQPDNYKELEEGYKKAIEINPGNVEAYVDLGWWYSDQVKYEQAEEMFKKAITINPKDAEAYIGLGYCYMGQGKFNQAEEKLKKAIEINPEEDKAYIQLEWCYRDQGKYEQAEEMSKKAIEINPGNVEPYLELGKCYRRQGKYEQAEEMSKKAIEINPGNVEAYFGLGRCYRRQGKYEQAEEMFKKAIEINPGNVKLYNELAICYEEQGKNKSAEEYLRKVNRLRLGTYNPVTRHNYQRLKEMVTQRGIRLVCVQYPTRGIEPLKKMFNSTRGIIFVDNERVFTEAVKQTIYEEYFMDSFAGDFGHCTRKGNRLLAENIADVLLKEHFNINE